MSKYIRLCQRKAFEADISSFHACIPLRYVARRHGLTDIAGMILLENHHPYGLNPTPELVETFFLSCMLHDIGTVPETIASTRMSFELWGAMHAHSILPTFGATTDQAELVAEVINRHQDLGETGMAPAVLGLIYFATIFGKTSTHQAMLTVRQCRTQPRIH
jgi:hypothetical protein